MGWLWGKNDKASPTDPLRDLDPSLRDFLAKESPVKYKPATAPPQEETTQASASQQAPSEKLLEPPESLNQDGRYAHVWKSYRPLAEIENEGKSDQEKLLDVLEGYKERKAQIGRAAVESCVEEQLKVDECFSKGTWTDRMTMCKKENRAFDRCYVMQSRFLKALGYLSAYERPASVDEEIQMHADTLYHRMLSQEKAIEDAKAAGEPVPEFPSILSSQSATLTASLLPPQPVVPSKDQSNLPSLLPETAEMLTPEAAKSLRARLQKMNLAERQVEERSVVMEIKAAIDAQQQVYQFKTEKEKRREEGKATAGDIISGWLGW